METESDLIKKAQTFLPEEKIEIILKGTEPKTRTLLGLLDRLTEIFENPNDCNKNEMELIEKELVEKHQLTPEVIGDIKREAMDIKGITKG